MKSRQVVLITGGAGFIGANLARKLLKKNYLVHIICRKQTNHWRIKQISNSITIHKVSLLSKKSLARLVKKILPNIIIHTAAYGVNSKQNDTSKMIKSNIVATNNLLEATKKINYIRLIYFGSSSEYGFKKDSMQEDDFLVPNSFYSATKAAGTYLCQVFAKQFNKPITIVRPFTVYGPFEDRRKFIPTIIHSLLKKKSIKITQDNVRHDFIYIDDLCDAVMKIIKKRKLLAGEIFNVGSGKEYTNPQVVKKLFTVTGIKTNVLKGKFEQRRWDNEHWVANISKAKKSLSWEPKFSLEKGLLYTYNWCKQIK